MQMRHTFSSISFVPGQLEEQICQLNKSQSVFFLHYHREGKFSKMVFVSTSSFLLSLQESGPGIPMQIMLGSSSILQTSTAISVSWLLNIWLTTAIKLVNTNNLHKFSPNATVKLPFHLRIDLTPNWWCTFAGSQSVSLGCPWKVLCDGAVGSQGVLCQPIDSKLSHSVSPMVGPILSCINAEENFSVPPVIWVFSLPNTANFSSTVITTWDQAGVILLLKCRTCSVTFSLLPNQKGSFCLLPNIIYLSSRKRHLILSFPGSNMVERVLGENSDLKRKIYQKVFLNILIYLKRCMYPNDGSIIYHSQDMEMTLGCFIHSSTDKRIKTIWYIYTME